MTRIVALLIVGASLFACGKHDVSAVPGGGFVRVSLALVPSDVVAVTATVSAADIATPISQALTLGGSPTAATGVIDGVPAGVARTVLVEAFPASPENTLVIYRGSASTSVQAGQQANVSITLEPVNADVSVTAIFPSGDVDVASVDHTSVVISGARVTTGLTYYLALNASADTAAGVASSIPVGNSRTFAVNSFDASGSLLFSGSATASVVDGSNAVTVTLTNQTAAGSVSINGGFCTPDCGAAVCGSDGCNGSCGGCEPGVTCSSGTCSTVTSYQYSVIAGTGSAGFSGDNGPATSAQLGEYLSGMVKDSLGNLYIADSGNNRLRKVDPSGIITTYAGVGSEGHTGDNGPATSAAIGSPSALVVDSHDNLYFAEFNESDIREINSTGTISTFAVLPGKPTGLAIDVSGNLYVAMFSLEEILKVDTLGNTTTFAGTGSGGYSGDNGPATQATFSNPNGVWADSSGNLLIDDSGNHVIRKVDASGTITTIVGTGTQGYTGDGMAATSAQINSQYGVVSDSAGNIIIADTFNNVVRRIDTNGIIKTIAGNGSTTYSGQSGPALNVGLYEPGYSWMDSSGAFYFSDDNCSIYKLTPL